MGWWWWKVHSLTAQLKKKCVELASVASATRPDPPCDSVREPATARFYRRGQSSGNESERSCSVNEKCCLIQKPQPLKEGSFTESQVTYSRNRFFPFFFF